MSVRFQVLTTADITPYSLVGTDRLFRGPYCPDDGGREGIRKVGYSPLNLQILLLYRASPKSVPEFQHCYFRTDGRT
jgi:hypothetical protein